MSAAHPFAEAAPRRSDEQVLRIDGVSWGQYTALRDLLDDAGLRMTYLEGALELMSPSPEHEREKSLIGRLIELYATLKGIRLNGYGSTTFRKQAKERGVEPDECYVIGRPLEDLPDIAIEVVLSSGGIDKLAVYSGLGIPEVWFFFKGSFYVYRLENDGYSPATRSSFLPDLDLEQLASFVAYEDQTEAVLAFRASLGL